MCYVSFNNSDLEEFSSYLGFEGIDADVFYESYYNLVEDQEEIEDLVWSEDLEG